MTATADPLQHTTDGLRLLYRSVDAIGNVEATEHCVVPIDTVAPTPKAPHAATVRRGKVAKLGYRIVDPVPNGGTASVKIVVKTAKGKSVTKLTYRAVAVNSSETARFKCKLARGSYRFFVYATDAAGNRQTTVASNRLVIR